MPAAIPVGTVKSRNSSAVVPASSGMPAADPAAIRASGTSGTMSPSMVGKVLMIPSPPRTTLSPHRPGSGSRASWTATAVWASSSDCGSRAPRAAAVASTPRAAAIASVTRRASSGRATLVALPLWTTAPEKSPFAAGHAMSVATLMAPADSPMTVTREGSPPNAATLSWTQCSARSWSRMPRFCGASGRTAKPGSPSR